MSQRGLCLWASGYNILGVLTGTATCTAVMSLWKNCPALLSQQACRCAVHYVQHITHAQGSCTEEPHGKAL